MLFIGISDMWDSSAVIINWLMDRLRTDRQTEIY